MRQLRQLGSKVAPYALGNARPSKLSPRVPRAPIVCEVSLDEKARSASCPDMLIRLHNKGFFADTSIYPHLGQIIVLVYYTA
jgi:hypothetical protein